MTEEQKQIERLRETLRERMQRVPDRINGASIQAVREYKKAYIAAQKTAKKSSPSLHELQSAINQVS